MGYKERLTERVGIIPGSYVVGSDTGTATAASGTITLENVRNVAILVNGYGTGTYGATVQYGTATYGAHGSTASGQYGYTSGGVPTWANLVLGTNSATYAVTGGEVKVCEVAVEELPEDALYLRVLVDNATDYTYGSIMQLVDFGRYNPQDTDDITSVDYPGE